jgi:hypothetical protein
MNYTQHISTTIAGDWSTGGETGSVKPDVAAASENRRLFQVLNNFLGRFRCETRPRSILRNQTNLPAFLAIALALSVVCNIALRQNTAEASRPLGARVSIQQVLNLVRENPDDYELHSRLGELYFQDRQFRRAMFHLAEASRLIERLGE